MKTTLKLLFHIGGLLIVLPMFAAESDFPEIGKSYWIRLISVDDNEKAVDKVRITSESDVLPFDIPKSDRRSSVKILLRATNGWCLVGFHGRGSTETTTAWINFNQVTVAAEDRRPRITPASDKPHQQSDPLTFDPKQELEALDAEVGHTLNAEQRAQAQVFFEDIAVRQRAEDYQSRISCYRRLRLVLTPEQIATRWVNGLDREVSLTPEQKRRASEIYLTEARAKYIADLDNHWDDAEEIKSFNEQIRALLTPTQREKNAELNRKLELESISIDRELAIIAENTLRWLPAVAAKVSTITRVVPGESTTSFSQAGYQGEAIFVVEGTKGTDNWVSFTVVWEKKYPLYGIQIIRVVDKSSGQVVWPTAVKK